MIKRIECIVLIVLAILLFILFKEEMEEKSNLVEVIILALAAFFAWRASEAAKGANDLTQRFARPLPIVLPPKGDFRVSKTSISEIPMFEVQNSGKSPFIIIAMKRRWSAAISDTKRNAFIDKKEIPDKNFVPIKKTDLEGIRLLLVEVGPEYSALQLPACLSTKDIAEHYSDESDLLIFDGYILYSEALDEYKSDTKFDTIYKLGFIFHIPISNGKSQFSLHLPKKGY